MKIRQPIFFASLLLAGALASEPQLSASAQTASAWPIVGGRQYQPTQQEVMTRARSEVWRNIVPMRHPAGQSETDRLYDEVMRRSDPAAQK